MILDERPSAASFPVDPEIRARIRPMQAADVAAVAKLHSQAMGRSLWAELGDPFLNTLYTALLRHPEFLGFVYVESQGVRGFIAGSGNGRRMMRQTFRDHGLSLSLAALKGVIHKPSLVLRLLDTWKYFSKSGLRDLAPVRAESMFCSFEPDLRGLRIAGLINKVLFDELAARGHRFVKITTEADNLGAIRQLTSWGFEQVGTFRFYGKPMVAWKLDLRANDRVASPPKRNRPVNPTLSARRFS